MLRKNKFKHMTDGKKMSPTMQKLNVWMEDHLIHISDMQKILFVYNLYIMVKAGLSIVSGLGILAKQVENRRLKKIIGEIKFQVEKGRQLSEVLGDYPAVFPTVYVSMIAAGETSGKLEESLRQVSVQMKKSHELFSRIRGAMMYPAVIVTAMIGIGIEMVVFILPKIIGMFDDFKVELPLPTHILVKIVRGTQNYGIFMLFGFVLLVILLIWLNKKPAVKRKVHAFNLRLPIAGMIIKKINIANFALTLSSLLNSNLPIIDAVKITAAVQTNLCYREALLAAAEVLKKGDTLSDILSKSPKLFPPMVTQMIMVGEESGQVEAMLAELSEYYGAEVDSVMRNFSTIIEPVIILIMGLAVAGMAVAVIMPMYSLAQNF